MNTWPNSIRRPITQSEHESWNASHYPGTRQLCCKCSEPTGRCEEDSLFDLNDYGPYCEQCYYSEEEANNG
jgi:hypothetical protein